MDYTESQNLALLLMRASLGLTVAAHGWAKFFTGGRISGTARWFDSMGMRPGRVHALLAASTELGAGLMLAFGLLHTASAAAIVGVMTVAGWTSHRKNGFFILNDGWEYVFIIAVMAIGLAGLGPGQFSIDAAIGIDDDLDSRFGLLIAAGGGVAAAAGLMAACYRPPAPGSDSKA